MFPPPSEAWRAASLRALYARHAEQCHQLFLLGSHRISDAFLRHSPECPECLGDVQQAVVIKVRVGLK